MGFSEAKSLFSNYAREILGQDVNTSNVCSWRWVHMCVEKVERRPIMLLDQRPPEADRAEFSGQRILYSWTPAYELIVFQCQQSLV